ncbi:hexosaminidase D-like [Cylas formicarius]|uniref:hexosaminidase D-like n=1 Tax=Cylas formicarius TaxID=197179 RepID=UPI002958CBEB|nr:hexosaminidase D-like [Cylas formicarius]
MIYSSKSNENIQIIPRYKKKIKKLNNLKTARIYVALFLAILLIGFYYYFREHIVVRLDIPLKSNVKKENLKKYMMQELDHIGYIEPELQVTLDERIIHLDLKGAPPKISYFSRLFPLIAELGGTGILIEYEDMFPYNGTILKNVSALNAYSLKEITIINRLARENNLKVIPLIQTFGHLEFLLKLQQYKDYREVFAYPQVICPSHPHTMSLIEDMIDQIIASHPDIEMLHIGCDEVYYLGFCERCTNRMINDNVSKNLLFLEHVKAISQILNKKYPHIRILLWDDQFRSMTETDLAEVKLNENLEPVIWRYTKEVYDELGPSLWDMYSKIFRKVWIASAYKGAIGSNKYMSDVNHYLQNHRSWLSVVAEHKRRVNFRGIIMAGWQRYDHFAVLCELLPIGIPALAMSLRLLKGFKDSPLSPPTEVSKVLKCHQPYGLIGSAFGSPKCEFPGTYIFHFAV